MPIAAVADEANAISAQPGIRPRLVIYVLRRSAQRCAGTQAESLFFPTKRRQPSGRNECSENLAYVRLLIVFGDVFRVAPLPRERSWSSVTSIATMASLPPASLASRCSSLAHAGSRHAAKTRQPSLMYCRVNSRPSPRLAPVMSATGSIRSQPLFRGLLF